MASREKIAKKDAIQESEVSFTTHCPDYDVTIHVENKRLYAPKTFLSMASPVFKAMLNSDFKEGKGLELNLPDKKYDDVLLFLQCLHPGLQSDVKVSEGNVYKILPLAHEYQVAGRVKTCEMTLLYILQDVDEQIVDVNRYTFLRDKPLERALHAMYYADLYQLTEAIKIGAVVISKANPKELQKHKQFMSLLTDTKCEVYRMGYELFFGKISFLY